MRNYIKNVIMVTVSFLAILATCYIWQSMPWYTGTDETFDFIVCIAGASALVTVVKGIASFIHSKAGNYKLVIKLERRELEEEK